jgi:hypothetical protein
MISDSPAPIDRIWALTASITGVVAVVAYVVLSAAPLPPPPQAALAFVFAFGLSVASVGLYHVLGGAGGSRLGLIATIANVVAAGELLAMLLIQMAVKAAEHQPSATFTALWLGLDVAWDLYIGTGTVLFGLVMLRRRGFGPWVGVPGILAGALLLVLNLWTFPTPPGEAGLVDVGPLVGLWYLAASLRVGWLARVARTAQTHSLDGVPL